MRSLIDFETQQPFAARFFTEALEGGHFVNAYLLKGRDMATMYRMALRLAQIINCSQTPEPAQACGQCQSCRWIEDNAHPGVITVSNLTYLEGTDPETGASRSKTGKAQKAIHVEQLNILLQELSLHSGGFHRVVILTGAEEQAATEATGDTLVPPKDWAGGEGVQFALRSLDRKLFPDVLSNRFLKTLEEPPRDVVFFLLADDEDKLLDTIVSRCQTVPFITPVGFHRRELTAKAKDTFSRMMQELPRRDFIGLTRMFTEYVAEEPCNTVEGLTRFQVYLRERLHSQPLDPNRAAGAKRFLEQVELAKRMITDKTKEEAVLEDLFLALSAKR